MPERIRRAAALIAAVAVVGVAAEVLLDAAMDWSLSDMDAYWNAALRLREGRPLYEASYSVGAHDLYRYAPWFAYAWVPLTYLPRPLVAIAWEVVLLVATAVAVAPVLARRTWTSSLVALLFGSFLLWTVAKANAQPLAVAAVVIGAQRRSGPLMIALATSLKAAPIAYIAVYIGRRDWWRVGWTLAVTAVLVAPMLLFDLSEYPAGPGLSMALFYSVSPGAWAAAALVAFAIAIWYARSRRAWLAASFAVIAAFPRLLDYDLSFLLTSATADGREADRRSDSSPASQASPGSKGGIGR
jgi:hypothetical protein